jgi:hypothetical protein
LTCNYFFAKNEDILPIVLEKFSHKSPLPVLSYLNYIKSLITQPKQQISIDALPKKSIIFILKTLISHFEVKINNLMNVDRYEFIQMDSDIEEPKDESKIKEYYHQTLQEIFISSQSLIIQMIRMKPNEINVILSLIHFNKNFYQLVCLYEDRILRNDVNINEDSTDAYGIVISDSEFNQNKCDFARTVRSIEQWIEIICIESFSITFGLDQRVNKENFPNREKFDVSVKEESILNEDNEIEDFQIAKIDFLNQQNEVDIFYSLLSFSNNVTTFIESEQIDDELKWNLNNFESSYSQSIIEFFQKRVLSQLKVNFKGTIQIRSDYPFENKNRYPNTALINHFVKSFDKCISSMITDSKYIPMFCQCLSNKQNEPLLQYHVHVTLEENFYSKKTRRMLNSDNSISDLIILLENSIVRTLISEQIKASYNLSLSTSKPLNEKWFERFKVSIDTLIKALNDTIVGECQLNFIRILSSNRENVKTILNILLNQVGSKSDFDYQLNCRIEKNDLNLIPLILDIRMNELNMFFDYIEKLKLFIQFCYRFPLIDITLYSQQLNELAYIGERIELKRLNQVCQPIEINSKTLKEKHEPLVTFFKSMNSSKMSIIKILNQLDRQYCVLFDKYFRETCDSIKKDDKKLTLDDLFIQIWPVTNDRWKQLSDSIENGTIKLKTLEEIKNNHFNGDNKRMENELNYLTSYHKINDLQWRNYQIELYTRFKLSYDIARSIEELRVKLKMTQNFSELDKLIKINKTSFNQWDLNMMDKNMSNTVEFLDKINSKQKLDCLNAYVESLDLVEWLREKAKNLGELKFLVELVSTTSTTTNETSATNMNRSILAKTLKEAGTAYASLIYNWKIDDTFNRFISHCILVCSHLESDRNIAQKLLKCRENIEILQEIINMKGNVEMNSLKQAKILNENGVYKIEKWSELFNKKDDKLVQSNLKINDFLRLEVQIEVFIIQIHFFNFCGYSNKFFFHNLYFFKKNSD